MVFSVAKCSRYSKLFVEEAFFHAAALFDILLNYRGKAYGIVVSLKMPTLSISINYSWWRKHIAFLLLLPSLLFFQLQGRCSAHRHTYTSVGGESLLLSHCCYPLPYFFNYRGEAQHTGIYLKRPL